MTFLTFKVHQLRLISSSAIASPVVLSKSISSPWTYIQASKLHFQQLSFYFPHMSWRYINQTFLYFPQETYEIYDRERVLQAKRRQTNKTCRFCKKNLNKSNFKYMDICSVHHYLGHRVANFQGEGSILVFCSIETIFLRPL